MAETSPALHEVPDLLECSAERWKSCEGMAESDLLRLTILRDLLHDLHAKKSVLLSRGRRDEASSIRAVETRVEELRSYKPLVGELRELISSRNSLKKRSRVLPDALFTTLDREKLERYDRQWEAAMVSEGLSQGWRVWSLISTVEIASVDPWHRHLVDQLWPHGIVLFVESAAGGTESGINNREGGAMLPTWIGRWICILHPKFKISADILLDFESWTGTRSPPAWRVLFSPKTV